MAWRLARSLQVLESEVDSVAPGTTFWTIGDKDHQQDWSDHNPNAEGVVCAADILGDAGLDLTEFVAIIVATDPPALKYVIHRDRIWFPGLGWQPYRGEWHSHVHVSVGWGPDGRSTGPYDNTSPWGLSEEVEVDEATMRRLIREETAFRNIKPAKWMQQRWDLPEAGFDWASWSRAGYGYGRAALEAVSELRGTVAGLAELVRQLAGSGPTPLTPEQLAALTAAVEAAARAPGERIAAALAEAGQELVELADGEPA